MFSTPIKWLLRLFKHVVVLMSVTFSWFLFPSNFFTSLNYDLRLTIVFSNFVHAECIAQHYVHVTTLFCASISHICGRVIRVRTSSMTSYMLLTVPKSCSVCSHYSLCPLSSGQVRNLAGGAGYFDTTYKGSGYFHWGSDS
jgi:hypothetical protein